MGLESRIVNLDWEFAARIPPAVLAAYPPE